SGYGSVANLNNAGFINSGAAAGGGLKVGGNFNNAAGATLMANLTGPQASNLNVTGSATLNGSLIVTNSAPLTGNDSFTVLTAGQGITGQFATTTLPQLAFVDTAVKYAPGSVAVSFTRNQTGFAQVGQTPNQRAVAAAINGLPANNPVYGAVLGLSAKDAPGTFERLSGDSHASLSSALIRNAETLRTQPLNRLRDSLQADSGADDRACAEIQRNAGSYGQRFSCQRNVWSEVLGSWQRQDGDGNAPDYRQRTGGVLIGGDARVGDGWRVGMALGYQDSTIWQDSRDARAKVDSYSVTLFGGKSFARPGGGAWNVMAGAGYAWQDIDTRRQLRLGGSDQELKASYSGNTAQVFGEVGYAIPVAPQASVEPFAGIAWTRQHLGGFSESGGSAALSSRGEHNDVTTTTLGVRGRIDTQIAGAPARLRATLGWRHAMGDVKPERTLAFSAGPNYTVSGTPLARNAAVVELGAEVGISKNAAIGLSYQGQYGNGNRDNAGFINVRWNF
ncbi:autotransporter domain-containing protein, partial [Achromobacter sp. Marseille-Q0513]|uniref:autotransporter outer membrane beta-barrel domain-containing protein n=1 Tax=Achromobacter sp. Marseille-Q0513 TaxID=2829161 RepID=UPI001B977C18